MLRSPKRKLRELAFLIHRSHSLGSRLGFPRVLRCLQTIKKPNASVQNRQVAQIL
jgi:hypothetical protein